MAKLYNLARMTTATTGTGTITLGSAVSGYKSFSDAGISNGETITYAITDGTASEIGRGVYTASGTTLTRSVLKSTNSNNAINLSGSAQVFITPAAEDIIEPPSASTDNTIPRFDGTSGRILQTSGVAIDDSNNVTGIANLDIGSTDTTLARSAAGRVTIEGNEIVMYGSTGPAWTAASAPTVAASSGSITSSSASMSYLREGKRVTFRLSVVITNNGTGAGLLLVTLPFTSTGVASFSGSEVASVGFGLSAYIGAGGTQVNIRKASDASYPAASGYSFTISGEIEVS